MPRQVIHTGLGEQEYVTATVPAGVTERSITIGTYSYPSEWHAPDSTSTDTSVRLLIGQGHLDPPAGRYWVWVRYRDASGQLLDVRSFNSFMVDTNAGVPLDPATRTLPVGPTPPDPAALVWLDTSSPPPVLRYWNGTTWAAVPGSGGSTSPNLIFGAGVYGAGVYSPAA